MSMTADSVEYHAGVIGMEPGQILGAGGARIRVGRRRAEQVKRAKRQPARRRHGGEAQR